MAQKVSTGFIVYWKEIATGKTLHVYNPRPEKWVKDMVARMNIKYKGVLHHWYEPATLEARTRATKIPA